MDENRKEGYVTGLGCLVIFVIFLSIAISTGWNTSGQIFWVFTILFGGLGFGSLWKPDSVGAVTSQFLKNFAKSEEEGSDSHNKQIQKDSSGSVQVMASDRAKVNISVPPPRKKKQSQESDAKGSTLWKPLPKINYSVTQRLLRRLEFPQVGWEAYNDSPYQLRVRIEVHPILGGRDLHPLSDNDINGTYAYEVEPQTYVFANGCFTLPQVCAVSKDELILEIQTTVEDINDPKKGEYKLVPRRWKYVREHDAWSYYPQRPMTPSLGDIRKAKIDDSPREVRRQVRISTTIQI